MERNIAFGEAGASKRRKELAGYANMLQELKNQGALDILASEQQFARPEQKAKIALFGAETEGQRLGNVGKRFYQGLSSKYGESFMRKALGAEYTTPQEPYAKILPGISSVPELKPKFDISSPGLIGGGGRFRGSGATGSFGTQIPSVIPQSYTREESLFNTLLARRKRRKPGTFGTTAVSG